MNRRPSLDFSVDALLAEARGETGIDIVDHDVVEPLTVLRTSYNQDAVLNERSVPFLKNFLLRLLCNRLRMQRDFAAHPEIVEQKIDAPIIICGMARTGSTKLQKLLAASGDFNWLPYWQSLNPCLYTGSRDESPEPRIQDTERFVAYMNEVSPDIRLGHEYNAHEPEEEYFLMMHCLRIPILGATQITGYMQWLMARDSMKFQLEYLRDTLKYLQWQGLATQSKPWVLKAPHYFGNEPAIRALFPDARFVMTHRHPKETTPSLCSFLEAMNKLVSDEKGNPSLYIGGAAHQINQHIDNRRHGDLQFLDIDYRELTRSVGTVADKVYDFCKMNLSSASRQRMVDWDANHPMHAKGAHRYALADFGFTEEQINREFAAYIRLLDELFGPTRV